MDTPTRGSTKHSPEFQLLLASVLYPLQDDDIEHLQECCRGSIDWDAFSALIDRHRVLPTVYRNLSTHTPELVPQLFLSELKDKAKSNQLRIFQFLVELGRISQLFSQEDISLCVLKGPLLSQRLFGDVSLRTCADLDLLISPETVPQAEALLLANGYERWIPAMPLTPRQLKTYLQKYHDFSYIHSERRIEVEMHWTFAPSNMVFMQDIQRMLSRANPTMLEGNTIKTLSDEDLPVYLLVHGSRHSWSRLKWLVDFVTWMRQADSSDWTCVLKRMDDLGLQRSLGQGVLLANTLFSIPIPQPVQSVLEREPLVGDLAEHSLEDIGKAEYIGHIKGKFERARLILYQTKLKRDLRYKWSILTRLWIMREDWQDLPLPDVLFPLYWLLRPFLWFQRFYLRR